MGFFSSYMPPGHTQGVSDIAAHTRGTAKGEQWVQKRGREPGRSGVSVPARTARDSTSICPEDREPIDPRMPNIPPV